MQAPFLNQSCIFVEANECKYELLAISNKSCSKYDLIIFIRSVRIIYLHCGYNLIVKGGIDMDTKSNMEYAIAYLPEEELRNITELERTLSSRVHKDVVLIAYEKDEKANHKSGFLC